MLRSTRSLGRNGLQFAMRQASDPFVARARREGYVCRSAFKLIDIDERHDVLTHANRAVIDLGSSPGGWSQVIRQRAPTSAELFGVDLLLMQARLPGIRFVQGDFSTMAVQSQLKEYFEQFDLVGHVDTVVSDMCPNRGQGDRQRSLLLNRNAMLFAVNHLKVGGDFVCKVLGTAIHELLDIGNRHFTSVHRMRPAACRSESDESFLVCKSRLAEPRTAFQANMASSSSSASIGASSTAPRKAVAGGNRVRPVNGQFGLDDWPGAIRRR